MATQNETIYDDPVLTVTEDEDEDEDGTGLIMTLFEHLEELRWRIFKSLIALVIGSVIAFIFREQIVKVLTWPFPAQANSILRNHNQLVVTGLTEGFMVFLKISIAAGVVLALPFILYQVWAFIGPGLRRTEKRYAFPFIFLGVLLFFTGTTLGYLVIKYPVEWLVNFGSANFVELITADSYFGFVTLFLLTFGLVFEIPLILTFLAMIGLISSDTLKKKRGVAHFSLWVLACFIMPGGDIWSPLLIGACMSALYELTFVFIRIMKK